LNKYAAKDKKYIITAAPTTTKRLGPSGSLKSKNSIFEHRVAVTANINNEVFFDLKYIFLL
jgi:hypothetical protein